MTLLLTGVYFSKCYSWGLQFSFDNLMPHNFLSILKDVTDKSRKLLVVSSQIFNIEAKNWECGKTSFIQDNITSVVSFRTRLNVKHFCFLLPVHLELYLMSCRYWNIYLDYTLKKKQ